MKHVKLITLLLAAGLTACSSDDGTETPPAPRRMTVEVTENPFIDSETGSRISLSPLRRAPEKTLSHLSKFWMSYLNNGGVDECVFEQKGNVWEGTQTWPSGSDSIDFYAYTGGGNPEGPNTVAVFEYNGGNPYITFDVEQFADKQHDLLVAYTRTSYTDENSKVSLTFAHACAAVQFKIGQSQALSEKGVTFTKIALVGVYNRGDFYYNINKGEVTPTWTNLLFYPEGETPIYTLNDVAPINIPQTPTSNEGALLFPSNNSDDYLFMIPQSHGNAKIRIDYTLNEGSSSTSHRKEIGLDNINWQAINWQAGYVYTINIRLGTKTLGIK